MTVENKTLPELFFEKAQLEARIRRVRVVRVNAQISKLTSSVDMYEFIKDGADVLNNELRKIHRNYIKIDDLLDRLEIQLNLEDE